MIGKIIGYLAMIGGTMALLYVASSAMALPDVHFSYSNDTCVKVVNYVDSEAYSCKNLPEKFNHVWVE